jgi:anti-anti-sigma factor
MNPDSAPRRGSVVHVDFRSGSWSSKEPGVVVRRTRSGRWLVLEIAGEMDLQAGPFLSDVGDDPCCVVFDLHGVTFMDCSSLRVLQNVQGRALDAGGSMRVAAASQQVLRILTLTHLVRAFPLFDSVLEATSLPLAPAPRCEGLPGMP